MWLMPQPIISLEQLPGAVTILGNGARMTCQPGLRYGTFDPASGARVDHPMPYLGKADLASPYRGMILIRDCSGPVEVRDVELDGNVGSLIIGGPFGDTGWQVPATGLFLSGNKSSEVVANVFSHHHALDGASFGANPQRTGRTRASRLVTRFNGRQGLSIVSGHGYDLADCEFSSTGRLAVHSAPGAGVDIEAETGAIRDLNFTRCRFADNRGCGMVADSGDTAGAQFNDCTFVGTTNWSAWPKKPGFTFTGCTFVGTVVHAFPDADNPDRATKFVRCSFSDDPRLSPNGQVYTPGGPIANLAKSDNVLFDDCQFTLVAAGTLPWSARAIYRNCTMRQRSAHPAMTKGKFVGVNRIDGPVSLNGSTIAGDVMVNGRHLARGPVGANPGG